MSLNRTPSPNITEIIFGSDLGQPIVSFQPEINNSSNNNNSPQYPYGISFTTSMPSASTSKTDLSYYEKRTAHNALERQRREGLNTKFQELAHVLPGLQQVRRPSKSMIVAKSLEFVSSAFERETDFKGQLSALKKENEQLIRQADIIRRRIRKRKQNMANAASSSSPSSSMRAQKKSSIKKSPSIESLKSDDEVKSTEENRSVTTSIRSRSNSSSSNSSSLFISSIGKKSPFTTVPTPNLVIQPRRTSSNLKAQVRSISLPCQTASLIDHANFSPPVARITPTPTPTATTGKRQREDSGSPDVVTNKLFSSSLSSPPPPPTLPFSSSSSSGSVHKKRRKSSESNAMTSSSSFMSPRTLTSYQPATFLSDEFMMNPMMNVLPSSSRKYKGPISISSPETIKSSSTSDFQFDIASLGTEQMFYSFDNHHHSSNATTAVVSTIPAVRMPIVNNTNNNNTNNNNNNNTMPTNNYTYVATDFLTSAILEDPEDHLFSWDN